MALYADNAALDIVQVIDYGLTGIIDRAGPPEVNRGEAIVTPRRLQQVRPLPPSGGPAAVASPLARNGVVRAPPVPDGMGAPASVQRLPAPTIIGHH